MFSRSLTIFRKITNCMIFSWVNKVWSNSSITYKNIGNSIPDNLRIQWIVTILPFFSFFFFITGTWHLLWNSCAYFVSEPHNERISSSSPSFVCQFPPVSGEQSKCLQGNKELQETYSSAALSFVSPENRIVCVSPWPMGGSRKEKLILAGRIKKVEKFPDSWMVWSLQPPLRH